MIIRGWQIDGFGHFRDQRSPELAPGLSVLHGPNEAGKSTLLAFIRGVLFGFPDKRSKGRQPLYEPRGGGAFGGSVFVEQDGRRYQIHRRAGSRNNRPTITDADGQSVPEGELPQILGGADETLFRNVFGFSLWELQEGDSLTDEGVRDRIFSSAVAGAGRDARKAAEDLEGRAKALYSPSGRQKKNRAAQLLDQIKRVDQDLNAARAAARDYPNKLDAEREAAAEKARLDRDIAYWRGRGRELDALLRLWEPWCARARALETLEQLTGRTYPRVDPLPADAGLDAQQRQADALRESLGLQRQRLQDADDQANQLQAQDERIAQTLADLGEAWTEERVEQFSLSIPGREEIRSWEQALKEADSAVTKAEEQRAEAERRRRESAERHAKLARALAAVTDPPDKLETLQQRQGQLEDLRVKVGELARLRTGEGYARSAVEQAQERLEEVRADQPAPGLPRAVLAVAALAAVAAVVVGALGALWMAGALSLVALGAVGAWVALRQRARRAAERLRGASDKLDTLKADAERQAAELRAREDEVRRAAHRSRPSAGTPASPRLSDRGGRGAAPGRRAAPAGGRPPGRGAQEREGAAPAAARRLGGLETRLRLSGRPQPARRARFRREAGRGPAPVAGQARARPQAGAAGRVHRRLGGQRARDRPGARRSVGGGRRGADRGVQRRRRGNPGRTGGL